MSNEETFDEAAWNSGTKRTLELIDGVTFKDLTVDLEVRRPVEEGGGQYLYSAHVLYYDQYQACERFMEALHWNDVLGVLRESHELLRMGVFNDFEEMKGNWIFDRDNVNAVSNARIKHSEEVMANITEMRRLNALRKDPNAK
jgi:hypothetical protein